MTLSDLARIYTIIHKKNSAQILFGAWENDKGVQKIMLKHTRFRPIERYQVELVESWCTRPYGMSRVDLVDASRLMYIFKLLETWYL